MRELMWQYPILSTWLICMTALVVGVAIVVGAYSLKGKDNYDD